MHLFAPKEKKKTHRFNYWREFRKHRNSFFQSCLQYTDNHYQDAEDLLSEAMYKAHIQMKETKEKIAYFHKWFLRIIYNIHLNNTGHQSRQTYMEDVEETINEAGMASPSPVKITLEKEMQEQLERSLKKLSPQQAYLCRLYFEGHSYEEIALANNLTINNLRKIIQLNKEAIRKSIQNYRSCTAQNEIKKELHDHLIMYKIEKETHYAFLYNSIPSQRLKQKSTALRNYLNKYPFAAEKRLQLTQSLFCLGSFEDALENIERLHQEKYFNQESFELQIKIQLLLGQNQEARNSAHEAINKLPQPEIQFHLWKFNNNKRFKRTELFLAKLIRIEPKNIRLRKLHIEMLISQERYYEAFMASKKAWEVAPGSLELLPIMLYGILKYESWQNAYSQCLNQYKKSPGSINAGLYYLHFLVKKGHTKNDPQVNKIYRQLRRKYFRHPDYVLLKAKLNNRDLSKTFRRRQKDYPDCVLSKYYSRYFAGITTSLPCLTTNEKLHFEILKMIYKGA